MLYSLAEYLERFDIPGVGVMQYLSFRGAAAIILALVIATIFGGGIIRRLKRLQIGEDVRDLGLEGQMQKKGTPTMGGLIILTAILTPMLLLARLDNAYTLLLIVSTVWLGLIGFADDYIKVFRLVQDRGTGGSGHHRGNGDVAESPNTCTRCGNGHGGFGRAADRVDAARRQSSHERRGREDDQNDDPVPQEQ